MKGGKGKKVRRRGNRIFLCVIWQEFHSQLDFLAGGYFEAKNETIQLSHYNHH